MALITALFFNIRSSCQGAFWNIFKSKRRVMDMKLPSPLFDGRISVENAIKRRRTIRSFREEPLKLEHLSQLLWAAQGITEEGGFKRAAPSGGALYPMDVYVVVGKGGVIGLSEAVYHYEPEGHLIKSVKEGDLRVALGRASLSQMWMAQGPVMFVITAEYRRICIKYGDRGIRYAIIEAGHIGQNLFLQAEALGLRAGIVGAFYDSDVIEVLGIPKNYEPLLIMPIGWER